MKPYSQLLPYGVAIGSTALALSLGLWLEPLPIQTVGALFTYQFLSVPGMVAFDRGALQLSFRYWQLIISFCLLCINFGSPNPKTYCS